MAAQVDGEFLARSVAIRSSGPQVDRNSDLRRLEVIGRKVRTSAAPRQVVDVTAQPLRIHGRPNGPQQG